ncbi:MAG: chorismate dehydratase [Saprospiraceae bacterium]|jgi:chorismate dehydratase|tara:strand:+ start:507 stop:1307 length:801 start_codon:yes stop_codon:yes gene_type:complete
MQKKQTTQIILKTDKNQKLNIAMVGYHNTLPFLYGLEKAKDKYNLILDVPSKCMNYFVNGEADVALVPVASLLESEDCQVITDFCIGCSGAVGTVCLYAHQSVETLDTIWLDSDSRTSQLLLKILCEHHWGIDVIFKEVDARSIKTGDLPNNTGLLMIGDKAFGAKSDYTYSYDLGIEWQLMTSLSFAFAVWIAKPYVSEEVISELNKDLSLGVDNIELVLEAQKELSKSINLRAYFEEYIDYAYNEDKKRAFEVYRELSSKLVQV